MGALDIAITVIVCVAFAGALGWLIYRKIKRKGGCTGCDCGCGSGENCPHCKSRNNK